MKYQNCLKNAKIMNYEPSKGMSFHQATEEVISLLYWSDKTEKILTFNGIDVCVSVDSRPEDLALIYHLKHELRRLKG